MAGKIRARDIEEVKTRINIADVIGEYVALRPASAGSLKGLCPFHDEKSPSFNVRPAQGFYHCFGCGEGGDVYKFVQQMDQLSFTEAVEKLAARIGFELSYEEGGASPDQGQKARILAANTAAADYYQSQLMTEGAIPGREFLKGRGFDKAAAEQFGIGFAPKGWNNLFDYLTKLGFTIDELVSAGLVTKSDRGAYDKFRGRLIWPIRDSTSQVIGFGARKLFEDDQGPKYLNTSDTLVYHKSQVLYGIDLAKKEISKQQRVVVVEGYTDVMACHLAGVTTAVATCGTAFGDDHIRIINRLLSADKDIPAEVIFTFDPDAAGQKAAMRAFADSAKFTAQTFVAVGPDGLDPCDLRTAKGDEAVREMIEVKKPLFEFAIKQKLSKFDLGGIEGRVAAARSAAPIIAGIQDPAMRPAYTRELAGWVNLDGNDVANLVEAAAKTLRQQSVAGMRTDSSPRSSQPETSSERANSAYFSDADAPPQDAPEAAAFPIMDLNDPITRFERQTLEVIVQLPDAYSVEQLNKLTKSGMSAAAHAEIIRAIAENAARKGAADWHNSIAASVNPSVHQILREIAAKALPASDESELIRYGQGVIARAITNVLAREKADLLAQLRRVEPGSAESSEVQKALMALESDRRALL